MGRSAPEPMVPAIASFLLRSSLHSAQGQRSRRQAKSKWLEWPSDQTMSTPAPEVTWTFTLEGFLRVSMGMGIRDESYFSFLRNTFLRNTMPHQECRGEIGDLKAGA